jgi:hypothetical protein
MNAEKIVQGRRITAEDISLVGSLLGQNPSWNRTRLSRVLCAQWGWRNGTGQLKDMACRTLLLKLERMGKIRLPLRQSSTPNALRNRTLAEIPHDQALIQSDLAALRPLKIELLRQADPRLRLFKFLLHRYHYLGHRNCVGENLAYLAFDRSSRPLACLLFGSAAWKVKARDTFIGWNDTQRQNHLHLLTNNTRFLILPWVRVAHLASHLLAQVRLRLSVDWTAKYGHPIHLLETFVQRDRFRGTCYRAAGWLHVGATTGRSRNDSGFTPRVPITEVYLQPLIGDYRHRLCS